MQYHAVPQQEYQGPLSMPQAAIHAAPVSTAASWITNPDAPVTIGGMSFVTQTAAAGQPKNLTLNENGEVVFDRGDGLRFILKGEEVWAQVPDGRRDLVGINGIGFFDFINDNLRANGLPIITPVDVENFRIQAIAFVPTNAIVSDAPYWGDNPVFVPEWWFHGDRYANLQPGVNRTDSAPLLRDMQSAFRAITPQATFHQPGTVSLHQINDTHDNLIRNAMQSNFSAFGANFPFNQTFFNGMTNPNRLRNFVYNHARGKPLGIYNRADGLGIASSAVNRPANAAPTYEEIHFFEVMRHFGMHSSMAAAATITSGLSHLEDRRDFLDYHPFLEMMLIQRIGEVEFLATAFWGNEDRLNHHVRELFRSYGFTLEDIQYARAHEANQRQTTGQHTNHSLLIDSFINAFCKELNLSDAQRARYKDIARAEIARLSGQARAQGLQRQNAFISAANGQNFSGLLMIPMRRSHLDPHMFPTRQHYLNAKAGEPAA